MECKTDGASESLTSLIVNILRLNKPENQKIVVSSEPYDGYRQLSDCALNFVDAFDAKGIKFVVELEDGATVRADQCMMEIVWNNRISNALKFTPGGGEVGLRQVSEDETITVEVSDTGSGMSKETMAHIFDKFYREDPSRSGEGNGLGLALVSGVMQLVDGDIIVESEDLRGEAFTVRLVKGK